MISPMSKLRGMRRRCSNAIECLVRGRQLEKVNIGHLTYNQDGLACVHKCDFLHDPRFQEAYSAGKATQSWKESSIHWRVQVACWAASHAIKLEGDFVECGVNRGGLAIATILFSDFASTEKCYYLLDTYKGLAETHLSAPERSSGRYLNLYDECLDDVRSTFAKFSGVRIIPGTVPETLAQVTTEKVAYLSIDMNCAMPELAAIEFFWPKLVAGGIVLLDDYGWQGHDEQKEALDRFAKSKNVLILSLPTGQGLLLKP